MFARKARRNKSSGVAPPKTNAMIPMNKTSNATRPSFFNLSVATRRLKSSGAAMASVSSIIASTSAADAPGGSAPGRVN